MRAKTHLDDAIVAARSLSMELYPPALYSSGLPAALRWLADSTREKYGLDVALSADPAADSDRKDVRTLLFESVRELLVNAVKHARVGRVTVDLALDPQHNLCITVTDQGIGFDPETLDDRDRAGQLGWGLFSIRERLTLLGGRFEIQSAPGRGTQVRLIAAKESAKNTLTSDPAPPREAAVPPPGSPLKVLIVDDHAAVRKMFGEILAAYPQIQVVGEASNGVDAIAQARVLHPDVILMDVWMPEMDGIEATRRIRAELPSIEVLGLSVQPLTEVVHPIERAGASGFFVKGADTSRLLERLLALHAKFGLRMPFPT
jgi:CheY-like chemotaxis protein